MGLGEVEQLLLALHESGAQCAAGAHRDLRLFRLVAGIARGQRFVQVFLDVAVRIESSDDLEARIEMAQQARHPIGFGSDEEHQADERAPRGDGAEAPLQAGDEEHYGRGDAEHHSGAEVGHHHGQNDETDGQSGRDQRIAGVDGRRAPGDEERQKDNQSGLGQFGRLQANNGPQAQPAMMRRVHEKDNAEQDQHQSDGGEGHRGILKLAVGHALERHHDGERRNHPQALAQHEVPVGPELQFGHYGRCAI